LGKGLDGDAEEAPSAEETGPVQLKKRRRREGRGRDNFVSIVAGPLGRKGQQLFSRAPDPFLGTLGLDLH